MNGYNHSVVTNNIQQILRKSLETYVNLRKSKTKKPLTMITEETKPLNMAPFKAQMAIADHHYNQIPEVIRNAVSKVDFCNGFIEALNYSDNLFSKESEVLAKQVGELKQKLTVMTDAYNKLKSQQVYDMDY